MSITVSTRPGSPCFFTSRFMSTIRTPSPAPWSTEETSPILRPVSKCGMSDLLAQMGAR